MTSSNKYGKAPLNMGVGNPTMVEYMTYQYLPIFISDSPEDLGHLFIPKNLEFARDLIFSCWDEEGRRDNMWKYIYLTAKRGYARPGNPLNRPGWHADGFGTDDVNYVWVDKYPTTFAIGDFGDISGDHILSVQQFTERIDEQGVNSRTPQESVEDVSDGLISLMTYPDKTLLRLDDTVVHAAPEIPAPGGDRSFLKVSFSNDKYNLLGNAHNYGLDYEWVMFPRASVRNDPARAGRDSA